MRNGLLGIASILCLLLAWVPVSAEESVKSIPNLVGTWTGEKSIYFLKGERHSIDVLRVTEQSDAHFRGTRTWKHASEEQPLGHVGEDHTHEASEPILGMIGFDNETIYMVEHDDSGQLHARLVDLDTMQVVYMEGGPNAAVFRVVLKRER